MLSFLFIAFLLFFLGAAVGSFLNVVINRSLNGENWVTGRSRCDHCSRDLEWYELVPLISYFGLGRKSKCCKMSLSVQHPVVEFLTGSLFLWWYGFGFLLYFQIGRGFLEVVQPIFWLIVGVLLMIIFFTDLWYMIIPDNTNTLLLILIFGYRVLLTATGVMMPRDFGLMLISALVVFLFFLGLWWLTKGRGMGLGDAFLSVPLALMVGWPNILVAMFLAFLLGAGLGIIMLVFGLKKIGERIPFGPFMIVGSLVALSVGDTLLHWYITLL